MSDGIVERVSSSAIPPRFAAWGIVLAILMVWSGVGLAEPGPSRIVIGGDVTYPPFEWLDEGAARGLNVDILHQAAGISGSKAEFRLGTWPDPLAALKRGDVDVVALFPSLEQNDEFLFTTPFYYVNHAIYAAPYARAAASLEDLTGQRVAMEARSPIALQLQRERIRTRILQTDSIVEALEALRDGDAEYAILPTPTADRLIHHLNLPVQKVVPSIGTSAFSFAVHRSRPDLFNWLQGNLEHMVATGRFSAVQQRWSEEMEFTPPRERQTAGLIILSIFIALLLVISAWSWHLRQRVLLRTQQLAEAKAAESQARHDVDYDSTTNLPKEHEFLRQVDDMLSTKSPGAAQELRLIKLASFNEVIKTVGREYAEQLVRRFADSIRHLAQGRPCGYLGRGVYALCHEAQSMPRIFETLVNHWSNKDEKLYSQIIGGSAYWPEDGRSGTDLIQRAETALNVSSANGKRWTAYSADMEPEADDLEMVSLFRADDLDGLTAVYQPQIDLRNGNVAAAEALVRWSHPTLGKVPPSRFIPLIEKAGMVSEVTHRMLDNAARMSASLRAQGLPSMISVNITISDLMEGDLPVQVERTLSRHGAKAADLKLELTETSVASDLKSATNVLHHLHDIGISLSVDDFGTGYSSLSYLSAFPIHEVKIDRHFVFDMVRNPRNRSIVRSTILMAGELGLQTVAEGAEDRVTLELLADYNCDRVQGYVFSPPLEESAFLDFIRTYGHGGLI